MRHVGLSRRISLLMAGAVLAVALSACGAQEIDETQPRGGLETIDPGAVATAQAQAITQAEENRRDLPLRMTISPDLSEGELNVAFNSFKGSIFVNGRRMPDVTAMGGNVFVVWAATTASGSLQFENVGALITDQTRVGTLWTYSTFGSISALYITAEPDSAVEEPSIDFEDAPFKLELSRPMELRPAQIHTLSATDRVDHEIKTVVRIGDNGGISITFTGLRQARSYGDKFLVLWLKDTLDQEEQVIFNASWLTVTPNGDSQIVVPAPPVERGMRQYNEVWITVENDPNVIAPAEAALVFELTQDTPFWQTL